MSWEQRAHSRHRVYCRTTRRNGRVIREYLGPETDPVVRAVAQGDALDRAEATAAVAEVRSEQAMYRELEPILNALAEGVHEVQEVLLLASGYRQRRGRFQAVKYRDTTSGRIDNDGGEEPLTRELFEHLAHRANRGDRAAAHRLRQILKDHPEIWRETGDLAKHAERSLIDLIAAGNAALAESVRLKADELRQSLLAEASDRTLEKLLIDHLALSWLELEYTRVAAAQPQQYKQDARFWAKSQDRATDRYFTAVKELATLRKLIEHVPD